MDADLIARELRAPGTKGHDFLISEFGTADRVELRKIIFSDAEKRMKIEKYFHPLIKSESDQRILHLRKQTPAFRYMIYEASLLIETGRHQDFDGTILVTCSEDVQLSRVMQRDGITLDIAKKILLAQMPLPEKKKISNYLIENEGTVQMLRQNTVALHRILFAP